MTFGIYFETCNVTNVHVSAQLTQALEEQTKIKYALANHIKEYENKKLTLENEQNQLLTDQQRDNERKLAQLKQQIIRANTEKQQAEMTATTGLEVAMVKADQRKNVLLTQV